MVLASTEFTLSVTLLEELPPSVSPSTIRKRPDKLVLMGPASLGQSVFTPTPMEGIRLLLRLFKEPSTEALKEMIQVFVYDPSMMTDELLEGRFKNMIRIDGGHLKNMVASMELPGARTMMRDFSTRLGDIPARTLATQGANDRFVPLDHGLKL